MRNLSISQARNALTTLPEFFEQAHEAVAVTRRGEPVMAVLPWDLYETLVETIEVVLEDDLLNALRQDLADLRAGRGAEGIPLDVVKKELGFGL